VAPDGNGLVSGAIYDANDGLAAVFGIVAGVSGAAGGSSFVHTVGLAVAIASALSMATGAFLAERSEMEVAAANLDRERQEIAEHPQEEREELSLLYRLKGIDERTADTDAAQLSKQPGSDAAGAGGRGVRHRRGGRRPHAADARSRHLDRDRGDRAHDPVHDHDRDGRDHCRSDRFAVRPLPGRGREVARDAPDLVVLRAPR
jgi:VIT family